MVINTIKHSIRCHATAKTHPGIALFRFNALSTFFNADYFKQRIFTAADAAGSDLKWFVVDTILIADIDTNGLNVFHALTNALEARGTTLVLAERRTEFFNCFQKIEIHKAELQN